MQKMRRPVRSAGALRFPAGPLRNVRGARSRAQGFPFRARGLFAENRLSGGGELSFGGSGGRLLRGMLPSSFLIDDARESGKGDRQR